MVAFSAAAREQTAVNRELVTVDNLVFTDAVLRLKLLIATVAFIRLYAAVAARTVQRVRR